MMGTNDVFWTEATYWPQYQTYIQEMFNQWTDSNVIVMSVIPLTSTSMATYDSRLTTQFNPFLEQQASAYGFTYLDVNSMLRNMPNWESYYSSDGVHLNDTIGNPWLARTVCDAVKAQIVPEPCTWLLLAIAGFALARCHVRKR